MLPLVYNRLGKGGKIGVLGCEHRGHGLQPPARQIEVFGVQVNAYKLFAFFQRYLARRAGTTEWIEHNSAIRAACLDAWAY